MCILKQAHRKKIGHILSNFFILLILPWKISHAQMPSPIEVIHNQIQADLLPLQFFLQNISQQVPLSHGLDLWLDNNKTEKPVLNYLQSLHAYESHGHIHVDIQFQSNQENPFISPVLVNKKVRLTALGLRANIWKRSSYASAISLPHQYKLPTHTKKQIEKNLTTASTNQDLLEKLNQAKVQISQDQNTETIDYIQKQNQAQEQGIFGYHCTRIADKRGFFFAEIHYPSEVIDIFSELPYPFNACLDKEDHD